MTQVIRLAKRSPKEIQAMIDRQQVQVEKFLTRLTLAATLCALFALADRQPGAAAGFTLLCVLTLLAYADRARIARFIVHHFKQHELLVLSVTRRPHS